MAKKEKVPLLKDPGDFESLVWEHTREAHTGLLREGSKGLKGAIYLAMCAGMTWAKEKEAFEKQQKRLEKKRG